MRKDNLIKLGEAINEFLKQEKLDVKLSRFAVKNSWKEIAGEHVANNTIEIGFNDNVMFLTLKSAALKQELSFNKQQLIDNVNRFCAYRLIKDIVFK